MCFQSRYINNFAEMVTSVSTPKGSKTLDRSCNMALFVGCVVPRDGKYLILSRTVSCDVSHNNRKTFITALLSATPSCCAKAMRL